MATILVIPDLHAPFEHPDALEFLLAVRKKYKPTAYVCLGDEGDFHAISEHDSDPDGLSAGAELTAMREHLAPIYKAFPEMAVCVSNHTARPFRKAYKYGIPKALIREYRDFMQAPCGWEWRDKWELDGVIYEHGEGFTGRDAAIKSALGNMQSTVIGHVHSFAGVQFSANPKHLVFGLNSGCLIDVKSYAFAYGVKLKNKPIVGCSVVKDGTVPMFIPMVLKPNGRWVGTL